jgi:hypothetical protein
MRRGSSILFSLAAVTALGTVAGASPAKVALAPRDVLFGTPDAIVDLRTRDGVSLVGGTCAGTRRPSCQRTSVGPGTT